MGKPTGVCQSQFQMLSLKNKKILIGISGGIAAYKIPLLVRLLIKAGAEVRVITSQMAKRFVTDETLSVLSNNPVYSDFFNDEGHTWNNHVELGLWADLFLVAPAGANTMAKMAYGICDNLLLTTYLSARCPVFFAPAMDLDMYKHASVQQNLAILKNRDNHCIDPEIGELASGLFGEGRMAEPETIFEAISKFFQIELPFLGKKVLVTAGPTYENIDPVRFIGNYSTGKMGFAIAEAFRNQGAGVTLIAGPVSLENPKNIEMVKVISAAQMLEACITHSVESDIIVMASAVADYKPENLAKTKIKKTESTFTLNLIKNPDILATLGKNKTKGQFLVGFALETNNELKNAKEKLTKKNLDMIVLNSLNDSGAGFGYDTNKVTIITTNKKSIPIPLQHKGKAAQELVKFIGQNIKSSKK